jgi:hypothetical protein
MRQSPPRSQQAPSSNHRFALALLFVIALALFALPLVRGDVFTLRDHFDYFQPLHWFTSMELKAGHLPLWNPYNASGEPWLANPQTGVFYPPAWLFLALPFATAYMLYLFFHVVLLGWGAYLLFARNASRGAALVGAVALMCSGPVLSLLDVSNNLATLAWIPLVLWCAMEGAWKRGAVVLALAFLGGEPFFAAIAAVLYAIVRRKRDVLATGLLAFGLCAIQLLPFVETLLGSDRAAGLGESTILYNSMPLRDWLRIVIPPHLGASQTDPNLGQHFIPIIYTGIVVTLLALIGIRKRTLPWLTLIAFAVIVSMGPAFLTRLPLTLFRYPARLVPFAALAIAALAAAGWDRVRADRRWLDLIVVAVVIVDLVPRAWPLLRSGEFRTDVVPYGREVGAHHKMFRVGTIDPAHREAWISGYLNLYGARFDANTAAPVATERYMQAMRELWVKPTRPELARQGIGWVLTGYDLRPAFEPVARAEDVTVYRSGVTQPMAALIMREPLTMMAARASFDTSHVRVTVDAPREGIVVLLQQDAPGWRATVDGVEAPSLRVDELFRGVQITRGHHEIAWMYRPMTFFWGGAITTFSLLAMTVSFFVKRTR